MTQVSPSGGELMLTGAANARIRATASVTVISLGIDLDADGVFEMQARLNWDDLGGPAGADLADTDGDGMHNSWETAFGLNPNVNDAAGDLDGDGFTNLNEYQVGARPNAWNQTLPLPPGTTKLPTGPASGLVTALANNSDIVYDSVSKRIYAAVRTNPGSVVPIDPTTGALGTPIPVGGDPVKLAISDDGQFLYIGLDAQSEIQRIRLATQAVDLTIALGSDPLWGPFYADDIEVLPGSPQSIAVSLRRKTATPRHQGVVIYDGNVPRPTRITGSIGSTVLQFSASAATLYGYDNESTPGAFRRMSVDANGVVITDVYDITTNKQVITNTMSTTDMIFAGGYLFFSNGQMIDPVAPAQLPNPAGTTGPTFTMPNPFGFVTADAALNRAFYLVTDGGWSIRAYNISTRLQIGSAPVPTVSGRVGSLIRWGARGLAFRTSDGQIFMVHSGVWIP